MEIVNSAILVTMIVVHLDTGDMNVQLSVDSVLASPKSTVVEPKDGDNCKNINRPILGSAIIRYILSKEEET